MKAIVYCRVSTEGQAQDGVSLDAQQARATAWCAANGYEAAGVHVDAGISGKRMQNRPGLQAALQEVCECQGALVVYSLSRLARSVRDALMIAERLERSGADLVSLSEQIDTTSAAGKMVFRMLAVLAEFERDIISERTRAAMQFKRARGERISQRLPFGYDLAPDGRMLVSNKQEQAAVQDIRSMRAAGRSYRAIAAELERQGVLTKGGKRQWAHTAVRGILERLAA